MSASNNKTPPGGGIKQVEAFIDALPEKRREEARTLDTVFRKATGWEPVLWANSMVGYGQYHYVYDSGREGDMMATGFRPAKARHSIYILPGYTPYPDIAARLGKHKTGKSCWYVNKLDDIDLGVLEELIIRGVADLSSRWPVKGS